MDITPAHWVFAGLFTVVFIIFIIRAYADDMRRTPAMFEGSATFLIAVILLVAVLVVAKILLGLSG